jgi:hypothetical protein
MRRGREAVRGRRMRPSALVECSFADTPRFVRVLVALTMADVSWFPFLEVMKS